MRRIGAAVIALSVIVGVANEAFAHSDPAGDVAPRVKVENGNFALYFVNNLPSRGWNTTSPPPSFEDDPVFRVVYSPTGQVLAPRHRRPDWSAKMFNLR